MPSGEGGTLLSDAAVAAESPSSTKRKSPENNNNDGVFVYTGFRPRIIFLKAIDQAGEWVVYDTARNIDNPVDSVLNWDNSIAESANDSTRAIDVLSNGFKLRTSNITINNTNTFVFGTWGDVPFKYNNVHAQS